MEPFQDEPVRIVVTAGGIPQPAMRDKAAFRHALLTDNEKACVCHDIIRIGVEVAFHAVYLDTLADITRNYSIVITLFGQIPVMGIGGTVTQEHGTLHIPLDGTLVRGQREEQLMETSDMFPCLYGTVLLQVLREGEHERLPLIQHIDLLALGFGKTVCLPHGIAHKQGADTQIDYSEQAQMPEAGLDIFNDLNSILIRFMIVT